MIKMNVTYFILIHTHAETSLINYVCNIYTHTHGNVTNFVHTAVYKMALVTCVHAGIKHHYVRVYKTSLIGRVHRYKMSLCVYKTSLIVCVDIRRH